WSPRGCLTVPAAGHFFKMTTGFIARMPSRTPDPDDPGAPVHRPAEGPPPDPAAARRALRGVIDPELHASIVELGMLRDVRVGDGGYLAAKRAPTTAYCPPAAPIPRDLERT